ncbi:MAG: hypothetical protein PUA94_06610 [Bacteroidales bacterium]|nr:hypothetical protein [Bacteroidales bacterium]
MADIKITGVMRAGAYSPNHVGNDAAIFNAVADELRKRGCVVNIYSEEQFLEMPVEDDIILNMCRKQESIAKLQLLEDEGKLVINSGFGIQNCTRERMTLLLLHNGIPYPESLTVNTNEDVRKELEQAGFGSCWIKRGDFHAMHKEDVSYCRHIEEAQGVLHEFYYRGIHRAVINRHLEGDLIKFYGVKDRPFFYWFYPFEQGHSKYGDEAINGAPTHLRFDVEDLHHNCQRAAEILDVAVYGGDAIIASDGSFKIIDFNDWPSFAPCRKEAAPHIARYVLAEIKKRQKR